MNTVAQSQKDTRAFVEKRGKKPSNLAIRFIFGGQIDTTERLSIGFKLWLAAALPFLGKRTIDIPPPLWQHYSPVLPPWGWSILLVIASSLHIAGRYTFKSISWNRFAPAARLIGSFLGFFTSLFIAIALWIKAPLASLLVFYAVYCMGTVAARLYVEWSESGE